MRAIGGAFHPSVSRNPSNPFQRLKPRGRGMAKAKKKPMYEPGYDGAVEIDAHIRVTATRYEKRSLRCRPGTFEWRYARPSAEMALYHAGNHYALLWEKAGTAAAKSPDLEAVGGGPWKGLPDGRAVAFEVLREAFRDLGKASSARLTAYCVEGKTTSELASQYGIPDRDMAAVLDMDLRACATHFRFR